MNPIDSRNYYFSLKKNPTCEFKVILNLYETQKDMLDDYRKDKTVSDSVEGLFVPARSLRGKYIGRICLAKDKLTFENIIHECGHAAIEVNRHLRRGTRLAVHEEKIVYSIGQLSAFVIADLFEFIIAEEIVKEA
jgi:hypothetical protein